jgi:hypothetical protein
MAVNLPFLVMGSVCFAMSMSITMRDLKIIQTLISNLCPQLIARNAQMTISTALGATQLENVVTQGMTHSGKLLNA